jgi:hypothetical protein
LARYCLSAGGRWIGHFDVCGIIAAPCFDGTGIVSRAWRMLRSRANPGHFAVGTQTNGSTATHGQGYLVGTGLRRQLAGVRMRRLRLQRG